MIKRNAEKQQGIHSPKFAQTLKKPKQVSTEVKLLHRITIKTITTPLEESEKTDREEIIKITHLKIESDASCVSGKEYRDADDPTVSTLFVVVKHSELTV